ncbi:MAG TPA: hypothetical protein PLM07_17930 [Candidatus Rifleibacterium sp.]|nr:hypothetical protein [Candidatus Rifleibacterium sp.]HPT47762.1 hypothetical protein [Candidatus Rifleibacterium sp.]
MVKKTPGAKSQKLPKSKDIFDSVTPADAMTILKSLAREDPELRKKIEIMLIDILGVVDTDKLSGEVFYELGAIQVEELWDRSGRTRDGYVDPSEESWEMFDEALEPFIRDQERFKNLGQIHKAKNYGMGILQGIYKFEHESKSDFKDWASDAPLDRFVDILNAWKSSFPSEKDHVAMKKFLEKNCPNWSRHFRGGRAASFPKRD